MNDLIDRMENGGRRESRRKILRAALDCFEARGIESTSIEDIRLASGSSVGSIYHHFKSREGLVSHLYSLALADQSETMRAGLQQAEDAEQGVKSLVSAYMAWVEANPREARLLFRGRQLAMKGDLDGNMQGQNRERFRFLIDWISDCIARGQLKPYPKMVYPSLLVGQAENYCRSWLSGRVTQKPTEVAGIVADACWCAVRSS